MKILNYFTTGVTFTATICMIKLGKSKKCLIYDHDLLDDIRYHFQMIWSMFTLRLIDLQLVSHSSAGV